MNNKIIIGIVGLLGLVYLISRVRAKPITRPISPPLTGIKGDIDGDGAITSIDAMMISQYVAGTRNLTQEQLYRADVNCDGKVDSIDAMFIAQYVAGTRTSFPC